MLVGGSRRPEQHLEASCSHHPRPSMSPERATRHPLWINSSQLKVSLPTRICDGLIVACLWVVREDRSSTSKRVAAITPGPQCLLSEQRDIHSGSILLNSRFRFRLAYVMD